MNRHTLVPDTVRVYQAITNPKNAPLTTFELSAVAGVELSQVTHIVQQLEWETLIHQNENEEWVAGGPPIFANPEHEALWRCPQCRGPREGLHTHHKMDCSLRGIAR